MQALILDASSGRNAPPAAALTGKITQEEYRKAGWDVKTLRPADMDISPCRGCFQCWVRTPGICVIDDDGRSVAEEWMHSDVVLLLTPVVFGGYASTLKQAMDRAIPILSPFFMKIRGEVHHRRRYDKYPAMVGIGVLTARDDEAAALFRRIVERHATNAHAPWHRAFVLAGDRECRGAGDIIGPMAAARKEAA